MQEKMMPLSKVKRIKNIRASLYKKYINFSFTYKYENRRKEINEQTFYSKQKASAATNDITELSNDAKL